MLKSYLQAKGVGGDRLQLLLVNKNLQKQDIKELIRLIEEAIANATDATRDGLRQIHKDFRNIAALDDPSGRLVMVELAKTKLNRDLLETFKAMKSTLHCAFWYFMEFPGKDGLFHTAVNLHQCDASSYVRPRRIPPCDPQPEVTVALRKEMERRVAEYFDTEGGRGRECRFDVEDRGDGRFYWVGHSADYWQIQDVFDEYGQYHEMIFRPSFEVSFLYDTNENTLAVRCSAQGIKAPEVIEELQEIFGEVALGITLPPDDSTPMYDLQRVVAPGFKMTTHANDHLVSKRVTLIRYRVRNQTHRKITIESQAKHDEQDIFRALAQHLEADDAGHEDIIVEKVHFHLQFDKKHPTLGGSQPVYVMRQSMSHIKSDERERKVKDLLVRWGIYDSGNTADDPGHTRPDAVQRVLALHGSDDVAGGDTTAAG